MCSRVHIYNIYNIRDKIHEARVSSIRDATNIAMTRHPVHTDLDKSTHPRIGTLTTTDLT